MAGFCPEPLDEHLKYTEQREDEKKQFVCSLLFLFYQRRETKASVCVLFKEF